MTEPDRPSGLAQTIKVGRCIEIGDEPDTVRVWVGSIKGSYVRLVVDAPHHINITRPRHDAGDQ